MLRALHTLVHTVCFWAWTLIAAPIFFVPAFAIWLVTLPFDPNGRVLHLYTCFWCAQHLWTNPLWRMDVRGREKIDRKKAYVYASNHLSSGDIAVLFSLMLPYKFVSKHQNFYVPLIGWNMYMNRYIRLRRGDGDSVRQMVATCLMWLKRGVSIMMFPEGTRSRTGVMLPFKLGAFRLAADAGVPVVPIVIDGSREALPVDGVMRQFGRLDVRVRILDPVDPKDYADPQALADAVRAKMEVAQRELWALRGFVPPVATESVPAAAPAHGERAQA